MKIAPLATLSRFAIAGGVAFLGACNPGHAGTAKVEEQNANGPLIQAAKDLQPGSLPGKTAQLVMTGTKVPVELRQERQGADLTLVLEAHGETFDRESYREADDSFAVSLAAGERYEPPIPLLKFPLRVGSEWDWKGSMTAAGLKKEATGTIATDDDKVVVGEVPLNAVKVSVNLDIEANPPDGPKAKRTLTFWFAPGKGVIKRAFGSATVREPVED